MTSEPPTYTGPSSDYAMLERYWLSSDMLLTTENMSTLSCLKCVNTTVNTTIGWWRGTVVERRSLAGELSLSCA